MSDLFSKDVRDKMVLIALFVIGFGCLVGLFFGKDTKDALATIVGALALAFKGGQSSGGSTTNG